MSFLLNVLLAVVTKLDPILGFCASIFKWVTSKTRRTSTFILQIVSSIISIDDIAGDIAKDLAVGVFADAIEAGSIGEAVDKSVPHNNIALKCDICSQYRTYYIKNEQGIVCKTCFQKKLERKVKYDDKVYYYEKGIYKYKTELMKFNFKFNFKFDDKFNFEKNKFYR